MDPSQLVLISEKILKSNCRREEIGSSEVFGGIWFAGASWFLLPYFESGRLVAGSIDIVVWMVLAMGVLMVGVPLLKVSHPKYCIRFSTSIENGQSIKSRCKTLPLHVSKSLVENESYQTTCVMIDGPDGDGGTNTQYHYVEIDDWQESRESLRLPLWVHLLPITLAFPVFLGALFNRLYLQVGGRSIPDFTVVVAKIGSLILESIASSSHKDYGLFLPTMFWVFSILYLVHLWYFTYLVRKCPTIHAVL